MRVAHIITRMIIGGAQENTLHNCLDLIEQYGDEVLLITGPSDGPEGQLLETGRAGGLTVRLVPSLLRSIHWQDYSAFRSLQQILRDFKPDVVHTHSAKAGFLGRAAAWKNRIPAIVHTVHGAPFHPYQNTLARALFIRLERWAADRCHHMISVADAMTDLMVDARVAPRNRFTTIYSGMDVQPLKNCSQYRLAARQELGFSDSQIVFGKIARLFHLKGHEFLIEAARSVIAANPNVHFLLVGDGILRSSFEAKIRDYRLQEHFSFTGLVPPERIPYYLSSMDVLVHTSLREGLARTLPQALISGRPVISYDIDGAREVVIDGQTGRLLPPESVDAMAAAILELADDAKMRERLGQGGADRFTEQFDHRFMTRRIRNLYLQILNQQRVHEEKAQS